jgi:hypothetical protein
MKKIVFITAVLSAAASLALCATLSVITMKNGAVYRGEITDFDQGVYTVEVNGKSIAVKEKDVASLGWENDGKTSVNDEGVKNSRRKKPVEKESYFYLNPSVNYMQFGSSSVASVFGKGMFLYGLDAGLETNGGDINYLIGLAYYTGYTSGSLDYNDFASSGQKITRESSEKNILMLNFEQINKSFILEQMDFFFDFDIGAVFNQDKIDSYPVDYSHYSALSETYPGLAVLGAIGLIYNFTDSFALRLSAGYQFVSMNDYSSSSWVSESYAGGPAGETFQNAGGIIYSLSAGIRL